jgi:hypothetical protein
MSDASYLSEAKARSRAGGHFYMGDKPSIQPEPSNGPILNKSTIMHDVLSSAAEAECGVLFDNTKESGVPLHNTLTEMGHPQPTTPVQQTNQTAEIQINGYAILLDPGSHCAETIQRLLVPRTNKSS